jgi:iron complex outermembrane receptor protein
LDARHTGAAQALRFCAALLLALPVMRAQAADALEVTQLTIEDLLKMEVTSVSRKSQRLTDTAAAAFVITADDIRRSGATSSPEALRMVPGLDVAKVGGDHWAVSARGFNGRFATKLLVLIDGRSVYSPLFSGVFWEAEDVMLEDLERIEVIRGPGAALWGANAVNGVINIITKKANATQGTLVGVQAGNVERGVGAARYGAALDERTTYRIWAKGTSLADSQDSAGAGGFDASRAERAGFRLDRDGAEGAHLSVIGNLSHNTTGEVLYTASVLPPYALPDPVRQNNNGANLLGRYDWALANGSQATLQTYLDQSNVDEVVLGEHRTTVDIDFQNRVVFGSGHDVIWGANYRRSTADTHGNDAVLTIPPNRNTFQLFSAFVHDEIELVPERWRLIAGSKFEHNSYTNWEVQPNLRLLWTPTPTDTWWAAASKAARTPSLAERETTVKLDVTAPNSATNPGPLPVLDQIQPNSNLGSEKVTAFELGYRTQLGTGLSLDATTFHNQYTGLRNGTSIGGTMAFAGQVPYIAYITQTTNGMQASSHGAELALDWHPTDWWRLQGAYTWFRMNGELTGDRANDDAVALNSGTAPHQQVSLRSSMNIGSVYQLDAWLRHVSALSYSGVPAYTELDLRCAWRVARGVELSLVGQNLLQARHAEFVSDLLPSKRLDVSRGGYVRLRWQF